MTATRSPARGCTLCSAVYSSIKSWLEKVHHVHTRTVSLLERIARLEKANNIRRTGNQSTISRGRAECSRHTYFLTKLRTYTPSCSSFLELTATASVTVFENYNKRNSIERDRKGGRPPLDSIVQKDVLSEIRVSRRLLNVQLEMELPIKSVSEGSSLSISPSSKKETKMKRWPSTHLRGAFGYKRTHTVYYIHTCSKHRV